MEWIMFLAGTDGRREVHADRISEQTGMLRANIETAGDWLFASLRLHLDDRLKPVFATLKSLATNQRGRLAEAVTEALTQIINRLKTLMDALKALLVLFQPETGFQLLLSFPFQRRFCFSCFPFIFIFLFSTLEHLDNQTFSSPFHWETLCHLRLFQVVSFLFWREILAYDLNQLVFSFEG